MPLDPVSGQSFEVSVGDSGGRRASAICAVLGIARRSTYYVARGHLAGRYHRADDGTILRQVRAVTNSCATYGLSLRLGYGESQLPDRLEPQAHSARHATARLN